MITLMLFAEEDETPSKEASERVATESADLIRLAKVVQEFLNAISEVDCVPQAIAAGEINVTLNQRLTDGRDVGVILRKTPGTEWSSVDESQYALPGGLVEVLIQSGNGTCH